MVMVRMDMIHISSSDEENKHVLPGCSRGNNKSKSSTRVHVHHTNSGRQKKTRISSSRSLFSTSSSSLDGLGFFCDDFEQQFYGSKVSSTGFERCAEELWVDKYKPRSLEELVVHKKKVREVKVWFEERLKTGKDTSHSNVLVITGPAGIGKSTTVQVIASFFGAKLCEWSTPTPTIWQEHLHNSSSGTQYTSKLDEFNNFIDRTRQYGLIPASISGNELKSPLILLIDDLPLTNGVTAFNKLKNSLHFLAQSTRIPTAVLITDYAKIDSTDIAARFEELQLSLETAGACKVNFNPITVNCIKKTLFRICRQEQCNVSGEDIDKIATASGGDIRNAITSLQYFCVKDRTGCLDPLKDGFSVSFGRDETLSLFHALGKFLHNKREDEDAFMSGDDAFFVREKFRRPALKMDAPEKILSQSHVQARPLADFLHENVLEFVREEAIDDAWVVASYLSDADHLLGTKKMATSFDADTLSQIISASVAARGVLFGNTFPLSSRWHAIRRPKLWQIEQSSLHNKNEIIGQRSCVDPIAIATEFGPSFKWLGHGGEQHDAAERKCDDSEEEIEDW